MINFHIFLVVLTLIVVVYSDHKAFLWFRGIVPVMDEKQVQISRTFALWGFLLICVTGFTMFWPMRDFLLTNRVFLLKMVFVLALGVNGLFIGKLSKYSFASSFANLEKRKKIVLLFSGFVSTFSWVMAIILAYMIF